SLFKYTVIRVPREVIDPTARKARVGSDDREPWHIQLKSLQARVDDTELIVLDEFNASGGTRTRLKELLETYSLGVRCYFSLFDFNPQKRIELDRPSYTLYSV